MLRSSAAIAVGARVDDLIRRIQHVGHVAVQDEHHRRGAHLPLPSRGHHQLLPQIVVAHHHDAPGLQIQDGASATVLRMLCRSASGIGSLVYRLMASIQPPPRRLSG